MISAREIAEKEKLRLNVRKETYRALLDQFCRKIKTASDLTKKEVVLTIPPFVIGYPSYDLTQTVTYMHRQLQRLGYTVERTGLVDLRVTWGVRAEKPIIEGGEDLLPTLIGLQHAANKLRKNGRS